MKTKYYFYNFNLILLMCCWLFSACEIDEVIDPNNPSISLVENPSLGELRNLVAGTESGMRDNVANYLDGVSMIGREYYRFSASDPRFTADLLGRGSSVLDNNTFYTTNSYADRYQVVKNANLLIEGIGNTTADINNDQKSNLLGLARTLKAYQLLLVLNQQFEMVFE